MFKRNCCRLLLLALLSPAASLALGLGDIHLKSALNAPLDAEIDLVGASAEELSGLKANLASRDTFTRYGAGLSGLSGRAELRRPRRPPTAAPCCTCTRPMPVNEPFATLLVEVNWARGHLVREYTVLLDPPVFSVAGASCAASRRAERRGSCAPRSGSISAPAADAAARQRSRHRRPPPARLQPQRRRQPAASACRRAAGRSGAEPAPGARAGSRYTGAPRRYAVLRRRADLSGRRSRAARSAQLVGDLSRQSDGLRRQHESAARRAAAEAAGRRGARRHQSGGSLSEVHHQYAAWNQRHAAARARAAAPARRRRSRQLRLVPPQEAAAAPAAARARRQSADSAAGTRRR